ncbi:hypothetical protein MLD38_030209 [Melastoma candidum]|uniref:Uncharacterized protein n=1 Tax=Melastoma candidum TaxID=119954 RepID=A0ACB9MMG8_9MYRT|nr:hypothetical protein MLD38_030209 [Melastoma candidum]
MVMLRFEHGQRPQREGDPVLPSLRAATRSDLMRRLRFAVESGDRFRACMARIASLLSVRPLINGPRSPLGPHSMRKLQVRVVTRAAAATEVRIAYAVAVAAGAICLRATEQLAADR